MGHDSTRQPADRLADDQAKAVLALAAKYYAEQQNSYSEKELIQAGSEVNIPAELMQKAIRDLEAQQRSTALAQQVRHENRRMLIRLGGGIAAITACWVIWAYNAVQSASARVDAAWAQVENQLQRRADLIPSLLFIATAPNQRDPSLRDTLQQASRAAQAAQTGAQKLAASQTVDQAVAAFSTAYLTPSKAGLKPNEELVNIQYELTGTANRLAVERMRFNQAVDDYNRTISQLPMSLVANAMGMNKQAFLQAPRPAP
jgi:LemA protein